MSVLSVCVASPPSTEEKLQQSQASARARARTPGTFHSCWDPSISEAISNWLGPRDANAYVALTSG